MLQNSRPVKGAPLQLQTSDGVSLGGFIWRGIEAGAKRPVIVISAATSVRCRYYARFADYLFANGFDVLTFDYRGIGESRPTSLRGFHADWVDWGEHDLEAALQFVHGAFPGQDIRVVGHSIGGFAIGLAPSNHRIQRILTVGSQFAHWRDYGADQRRRMYIKWHIVMPLFTRVFGYFPAKRLGWMEDTPAGVVRDWSRMKPRFEHTVRQGRMVGGEREADLLHRRFGQVTAPILAIGLEDDPHGTTAALARLLAYFTSSHRRHWRIAPSDIGVDAIGHFAFFHDRFKETLWPLALEWLRYGEIPEGAPGGLVAENYPPHRQVADHVDP
ncbi:alpha/beta fold hydrolase [Rhizobium sp. L1K21]|uniref:alpha/beta hydrolase family protein n=1 Tax=Rhizobium sp. L1K21 TaxID=2954933 RepID=UPI002093BFFF|nr:alpha/beta fold hydrolase [Rhizobium sp. L1K21]MCO6184625.1 alpha/beta fold hydrolase [Rhizobium sp. L1K21]